MKTREQQYSHHVSVPSDEGKKVEQTITIYRPVAEVYAFWRRLANLPRFMRHLQSVTERDGLHSHWVVKALSGQTVEWDAEIIERRENEMISWRSTPGSDVGHKGQLEVGELAEEGPRGNWSTRAMAAGRKAAGVTDDYVHESPWIVIGSVAFGCLLLGFLLGQASRAPYGSSHVRLRRK